jgi:flagella basal body P-ring formation protein FlgA
LLPFAAAAGGSAAPQEEEEFQSLAQLESLAKSAAAAEFPPLSERQRLIVGPIPPHTQLAKCSRAVRALPTSAHHMQDRLTIELQCTDLKSWHYYVPVRIVGISTVVVAAHALVMGTVLQAGGAYVTNQQLVASKAVQRGQSVTLVADAGGMTIRTAGRALTDGLVNQRVRVTNLSSGKVVEGIARSAQVVEIILQ